jgi:hypothetical protein
MSQGQRSTYVPIQVSLSMLVGFCLMICSGQLASGQRTPPEPPPAQFGLQITLPNDLKPLVTMERGGAMVIQRRSLTVASPQAAGDLTGVDLNATPVNDGMKVELWIVYNDLSDREWWKNKNEKLLGQYLVRQDSPVRPAELLDYGIIPFELSLIRYKNREFKPGEGPPITNMTTSLQVAKLERIGNHYQLTLKNTSGKKIISYRTGSGAVSIGGGPPASSVGIMSDDELVVRYLPLETVDSGRLKISSVVFEDGSFEGDAVEAAIVLAEREGFKIQSPSVLERVQAALMSGNENLVTESLKLEAGLWTIPEAIDKASAVERLKTKYPEYDDKLIGILYESLKGGLYNARNYALVRLGELKRRVGEADSASPADGGSQAQWARVVLNRLKDDYEDFLIAR